MRGASGQIVQLGGGAGAGGGAGVVRTGLGRVGEQWCSCWCCCVGQENSGIMRLG